MIALLYANISEFPILVKVTVAAIIGIWLIPKLNLKAIDNIL